MKATSGIILNIWEGQIDSQTCKIRKINAYLKITHGNIKLSTFLSSDFDKFPKWNQIFYIEKQSETIDITLIHKPLLLKDEKLGSCTLPLTNQNGWVHLFKEKQKIGSLKLSISNDFLPINSNDIYETYHNKINEIHSLKKEAEKYKLKYKLEKQGTGKKASSGKITELIQSLKNEQENYKKLQNEINEQKIFLKKQEESILIEKEKILKARENITEDEKEIERLTFSLRNDINEIKQNRSKISIQERIFKSAHRNSKSEGRNSSNSSSPLI